MIIRILYSLLSFLALFLFGLVMNEGRMDQLVSTISDTLHFALPLLFILLIPNKKIKIGVFLLSFVGLSYIFSWPAHEYFGDLVYAIHWPIAVFILFIVGHYIFKKKLND